MSETLSPDAIAQLHYSAERKNTAIAYLLLLLLGNFGAHRVYLRMASASIMTLIGCAGWFMLISGFTGKDSDKVGIGLLRLGLNGVICLVDIFRMPFLIAT